MSAEVILNLFQTVVMLLVFIETLRFLGAGKGSTVTVFFAFAVASALLSSLYWLAYDILRPGTRMPFAANEIGEWALFLMLGASLSPKPGRPSAKTEMFCAALFAAANVALWIAWSGEWVEDILTGAAFGYLLCCLVARIRQEGYYSAWEWRLLAILCPLLIAAQTATFFVPEALRGPLDLFCYALLLAGAALFLAQAIRSLRKDCSAEESICRCYAAHVWVITMLYMSEGGFYIAALAMSALCFVGSLLALKKEAL